MKENSKQNIYSKITGLVDISGKKLLEVGCGEGKVTSMLAGTAGKVTAVDPDKPSIEKAREAYSGIDFRIGSGEGLQFDDSSFDLVVFTLSLHHQNSMKALEEARRVVKAGGSIVIVEPVVGGELEVACSFFDNEDREKKLAQEAVNNCGMQLKAHELFYSDWEFSDVSEFYDYFFEYYRMPFSEKTIKEIEKNFSHKINDVPFSLKDHKRIQVLR